MIFLALKIVAEYNYRSLFVEAENEVLGLDTNPRPMTCHSVMK